MKNKILSLSASLLLLASVSTSHVAAEPIKIGAAEISFNAGYMSSYQWRGEDQNSVMEHLQLVWIYLFLTIFI